jgi:hypothetical protein
MLQRYLDKKVVELLVAGLFLVFMSGGLALLVVGIIAESVDVLEFLIPCGVGLLVGLWPLLSAAYYVRFRHLRPSYRRLNRYGDPAAVLAAIDRKLGRPAALAWVGRPPRSILGPGDVAGGILLTPSWLIEFEAHFEVRPVRLAEVVGVRKAIAWMSGGKYAVKIRLRLGADEEFVLEEGDADRLLIEVAARLPWVQSGLNDHWRRSRPTDADYPTDSVEARHAAAIRLLAEGEVLRADERAPDAGGRSDLD